MIAARGGSKGIPGKNLIDFCGRPLISWSIEQAGKTKGISSVWVTSDSEEILSVSQKYGAKVVLRPSELATDTASSEVAWRHALDVIEKIEGCVDTVVALQATSPLREPEDLERGLRDFKEQKVDSLFSCSALEDFFIWTRDQGGELQSVNYDYQNRKRRQDIQEQYVENGSFYLFKPWVLRETGNRLAGKMGISKMEFWKMFEIDSLKSLEMCQVLMNHYLLGKIT